MAKRVQVALTESIASLGKEGDLVDVAPGYARNFLLPYGKAMNVTPAVLKQIERKKEKEKIAADKLKQEALDFQTALSTIGRFTIKKTGWRRWSPFWNGYQWGCCRSDRSGN